MTHARQKVAVKGSFEKNGTTMLCIDTDNTTL